ncbi:MAG: OmpH family outer membrane protein [Bacteroidales bacterium]|nr:OmpH family outer membrane protein [Bacteroidales bacterium]
MKKVVKFVVAAIFVCGVSLNSQAQKFGHIDFEELIAAMPEKAEAQKTLEKEYNEMKGIIESMSVEFNKKMLAAQQSYDTLSKASQQLLEQELQDMQNRIMQYQQNAETQLNQRQQELLNPIIDKAEGAVKKIAAKEGFFYIFDTSKGSQILYYSDKSIDVMPLVKKELGI